MQDPGPIPRDHLPTPWCQDYLLSFPNPDGRLPRPPLSRMNKVVFAPFAALLLASLTSCHQVPVTGRRAVNMVDDKSVSKMSIAEFDKMKASYPRSRNREHIAALNRVGDRLSKVVFWDMPDAEWEFVVFEVPNQINAFAMAGGKVGVFSGLFKIVKNDDQLASVIAHEIAHVTAKHVHERLSQQMLISGGGIATGVAMMGTGVGSLGTVAIMQAYGISTGAGALAFDRGKEKEADYIGVMYMARAGYDPQAAIQVIEALDAESAGKPLPPAILSTHPSNPERILQLMDAMPKALETRAKATIQAKPVLVK